MPYNREELTPRNIISDTFETSITWEKFDNFYHNAKISTELAIKEITGKSGAVSCRFSHSYQMAQLLISHFMLTVLKKLCWKIGCK